MRFTILLPDTERAEDAAEQVIRSKLPGDFAQGFLG